MKLPAPMLPALRSCAPMLLYALFAATVWWLQGDQPPINIDHIAYFKLTDNILAAHPAHDYWRSISTTSSYGVMLAYAHAWTGDHVASMKLFLALMTVAYLGCAEYFFRQFTPHRALAVLFSLISALHLSFGTVFWGMTDFAASLNRSLPVPLLLLLTGWYFSHWNQRRRLLIYPGLIYLSLLHLGTYYLLGVLAVMDGCRLLHLAWVDRHRLPRAALAYAGSFVLVGAAYYSLSPLNLSGTILRSLIPTTTQSVPADTQELSRLLASPGWSRDLGSREAWDLEIQAQPWRNFPIPLATLAGAASSLAFILPLVLLGTWIAINRTGWKPSDRLMLLLAGCVLACSYFLQFFLWIARHWLPIYPISFEEVRTVSFLALPILYFAQRGFAALWFGSPGHPPQRAVALAALGLFLLQPIYLVRMLPSALRGAMIEQAQSLGVLDPSASLRNTYARQILGLETQTGSFYYSVRPVLDWLEQHAPPHSRILTNRDDLFLLPMEVVGTANAFLNTSSASYKRRGWSIIRQRLADALARRDLSAVLALARECEAGYAVVPWPVPAAAFQANSLSVIIVAPQ